MIWQEGYIRDFEWEAGSVTTEKAIEVLRYACFESESNFVIDYPFGLHSGIIETCQCVKCGCDSRMWFMVDFVKKAYSKQDISIYMDEYITATYCEMKKFFPKYVGSEFLGDEHVPGEIVGGIRH